MQCACINECVCANDRLYVQYYNNTACIRGSLTSDQVKKDLYGINIHIVME